MGITEEVNSLGIIYNVTYLTHGEVVKESRSTKKLRVVFDASVKVADNTSLPKPCLSKPIAPTEDIEKAFLQIIVHEIHCDLLRCLWFKHLLNSEATKFQAYRFTRPFFGASSLPFLLNATPRKHG